MQCSFAREMELQQRRESEALPMPLFWLQILKFSGCPQRRRARRLPRTNDTNLSHLSKLNIPSCWVTRMYGPAYHSFLLFLLIVLRFPFCKGALFLGETHNLPCEGDYSEGINWQRSLSYQPVRVGNVKVRNTLRRRDVVMWRARPWISFSY